MSKLDLYRTPANDNPTQPEKLPKEPLDFQFPITTKPGAPFTLRSFLFRLALVSLFGFVAPLSLLYDAYLVGLVSLCLLISYVHRTYKRVGTKVAGKLFTAYLIAHFSCFLSFNGFGGFVTLMFFGTVAYTLHVARKFRLHWNQRAACGMLPRTDIKEFLQSGKLPAGVKSKPTLPAFAAALRSWITYDPFNSQAAGVFKCSMGEAQNRVAASLSLAVLWAGVLVTPQALSWIRLLGNPVIFWPLALVTIPFALPLLSMFLSAGASLGKAHGIIEHQFDPKNWTPFIRDLQTSKNSVVRNSIFLGRVHGDGSPILYPAERLMRGGWIQGSPGSGKTLSLMQTQEQLIELGYSVVVLDLKASSFELMYSAHAAAQRVRQQQGRNVPIYPFTSVCGKASYLLDIYSQKFWSARSPEEKASIMLGFFGLNGAQVYGESWYRDAAWTVKQHLTSKYQNLKSFHEAAQRLGEELEYAKPWELSRQVKQDGEHPRLILNRLGMLDALNARSGYSQKILDRAINLVQLFQTPSVLYCGLPSITDPVGNPEVGRVILSSLLATATHTQHRPVRVVVLIDEFQRMVSRSLDIILQQARSRGVGVILTNQSSADLRAVDQNMPDTIAGNTAFQAWIKATDNIGVDQVRNFGGQYIEHLYSTTVSSSQNGPQTSRTTSEHVLDRVSTGLIDRVNASHDQYFLRISDDGGYAAYGSQLFIAQSGYHTATEQEYNDRMTRPWPDAVPGMLVNGEHRPSKGPTNKDLVGRDRPNPTSSRKRKTTPLNPPR
ncbi:TraM recognition domain-containing protein [Bythopirellula goksoeyrii]|uniref:AAA-like domain protein n=1 Tax=Bythopirellula goksoeyrii TaxID=1400387 RepID=A0A5B9QUI0_9BACT|nr:TraM recognition domain-containing protein [Bythopirellula goksoeyrii]QEG37721.1 AAA-like domain protein [Bythopirellula goksoeyrii]